MQAQSAGKKTSLTESENVVGVCGHLQLIEMIPFYADGNDLCMEMHLRQRGRQQIRAISASSDKRVASNHPSLSLRRLADFVHADNAVAIGSKIFRRQGPLLR
jgi:hypothetical protein